MCAGRENECGSRALAWSKMNERFIRLNSRQTRFIIFTYNCLVEMGIFTTQTPTCNQRNTCILLCLSILYPWRPWELHQWYHVTSVSLTCLFTKEHLDGYTRNIIIALHAASLLQTSSETEETIKGNSLFRTPNIHAIWVIAFLI